MEHGSSMDQGAIKAIKAIVLLLWLGGLWGISYLSLWLVFLWFALGFGLMYFAKWLQYWVPLVVILLWLWVWLDYIPHSPYLTDKSLEIAVWTWWFGFGLMYIGSWVIIRKKRAGMPLGDMRRAPSLDSPIEAQTMWVGAGVVLIGFVLALATAYAIPLILVGIGIILFNTFILRI